MGYRKHLLILLILIIFVFVPFLIKNKKYYYAEDFNISVVRSIKDIDNDDIDDYTDILEGAMLEVINPSKYKSVYYDGGYPPDGEGVCTDVIWRALKKAGYNLKELVDEDIKNNPEFYTGITKADPNIDFRRVYNLKVFFERHTTNLTKDLSEIKEWQPGDIVIFGTKHIGIISDKRNSEGVPYLIHNANTKREENVLKYWDKKMKITGHYRFLYN
ncbi:MAG: DUF1287 domain-containing protein [Bacilli bacterium]|nr:DUF1287 domain-containing protein [Bacilli bacterium]MDD4733834.1 DUF1287 domain-containing protein [Bacilli bacterium]